MTTIAVVGDVLVDRDIVGSVERVCPDAPVPVVDVGAERTRAGGAGLVAERALGAGAEVALITALGADDAGDEARVLLQRSGAELHDLGSSGATAEKIRVRAAGQSLLRLDRGASGGTIGALGDDARAVLRRADAIVVADYGRGIAADPSIRAALAAVAGRTPIVWDPHPRGAAPVPGMRLATPNEREAAGAACGVGSPDAHPRSLTAIAADARALVQRWAAGGVVVTMGSRGAMLVGPHGPPLMVPAPSVDVSDACGAGDHFAATAAVALGGGALVSEAVEFAVAETAAFLVGGSGWSGERPSDARIDASGATADAAELIRRARARGATVVATGGCFDLLHAGHVAMLDAARRLGDHLVVLLNSDASVRRLKGSDRPLQPEHDRAAILAALDSVDAVVVFDEDTPQAALARLRPDVFVKGGDYAATHLPESVTMAAWGGQAVVVPYLAGRSTTHLVRRAKERHHA